MSRIDKSHQQAAFLKNLEQQKSTTGTKGPQQFFGLPANKKQRMGGNSNAGQIEQNQKVADEFFTKFKRMYDNGELSNQQSGRQF